MAIQVQPSRIPEPFAGSGTKNAIPATNSQPSASQAASWASGFPPECSQPLSAGGCPVPRDDVNGTLNQISQDYAFRQDGGVWAWSALADYDVNRMVLASDGKLYWSVAQSGPNVGGTVNPTTDDGTYWVKLPSMTDIAAQGFATQTWVADWFNNKIGYNVVYVDPVNGDDSNNGLSAATAKKTIAAAKNAIRPSSYLWPSLADIHLAAGNYNEGIEGGYGVVFQYIGPSSGTANLSGTIVCSNGNRIFVGGNISVTDTVQASRGGSIFFQDGAHIYFSDFGTHTAALYAYSNGNIFVPNGSTVAFSFTGSLGTVTAGTVVSTNGSTISIYGTVNWNGGVNGARYTVLHCSILQGVGSATAIPGTSSGTVDTISYFS